MSSVTESIKWDFTQPPVSVFTLDDVQVMQDLLNEGNRAGSYLYYYMKTGNLQALTQAEITTYSGFFGGAALYGNYLAKVSNPDYYNLSLDKFSIDIVQGNIDAIRADILNPNGNSGILDAEELRNYIDTHLNTFSRLHNYNSLN